MELDTLEKIYLAIQFNNNKYYDKGSFNHNGTQIQKLDNSYVLDNVYYENIEEI